ncbi:hypothetical protein K466DRAFT_661862 [Polyporus arcularius HHB13444]|uniref:F-box domain-containing protein n=1 Tax=Polyporus arcularius HHB13444 TaxID=1314778 RepID=A0A5C3PGX6_9APHY|nr:hypothetical protein K466DRAFT_661862 [Polyporus arcularius HHB13444]
MSDRTTGQTLSDLPPEILHLIVAQLGHPAYVRSCSCIRRRIREVALEHLNSRRLSPRWITSFQPLVRFLRTYPRVARTVTSLHLHGASETDKRYCTRPTTTIDDTIVASIMELLPELDSLSLEDIQFTTSTTHHSEHYTPGSFLLATLAIWGFDHEQTSLTGVLRVLSLFTVVCLERLDVHKFEINEAFDTRHLHRQIDIRQLQELSVRLDSGEATVALGELLARAGSNITTLAIDTPLGVTVNERVRWVDPLQDNWRMLNLSACKKLESISLPIHISGRAKRPVTESVIGILSQVSPTLRKVTICATGRSLYRFTTSKDRTVFKLHELDEALSPTRFPHLQQCVYEEESDWMLIPTDRYLSRCLDLLQRELRGLHDRGLLEFVGDDE